jgi:pheromone shutdown protein TraB
MELSEITLAAFAAFNALRLFSYFPQIVRIATDTNGASAISFSTWFLWTGSHLATGAYAAVNLNDRYLTLASALFASCCVAVIALTAMKRRGLSRAPSARLRIAPIAKYPSEKP